MSKIKVFIIDDSATVRMILADILNKAEDIEVIGAAQNPVYARRKMDKHWPDVILLDIEMPEMDGLTFLKQLMQERPTPIVMCSTLTKKGSTVSLEALNAGAVEVICKPKAGVKGFLQESIDVLQDAVRAASKANLRRLKKQICNKRHQPKLTADVILKKGTGPTAGSTADKVIAIGTSTGGTHALELILPKLPKIVPGIVVVQHMPEQFTRLFADRLNSICAVEVKEAETGDRVLTGRVLIAPGGRHMLVENSGSIARVSIKDGPPVSRHRPSVDVLFRSVAKSVGCNAMGVIMTGMGDDGAAGLKEMHESGSVTLGQDEDSCVVYGMPKVAKERGAVGKELPLWEIGNEIVNFATQNL